MPSDGDGVEVAYSLRRAGYEGFTYLWTGADPTVDLDRHVKLFAHPGAGGYSTIQVNEMAQKVHQSWLELNRSFRVADAAERLPEDPLDSALSILSELQAGLLLAELERTDAAWHHARAEAQRLFEGEFTRVFNALQNPDFSRRRDASAILKSMPSSLVSDPYDEAEHARRQRIAVEKLVALRDTLLLIAASRRI